MKYIPGFFLPLFFFLPALAQQLPDNYARQEQLVEAEKKQFIAGSPNRGAISVASSDFHVNYYRCQWNIDPAIRAISGRVTTCFTITSSTDRLVYDLSDTLSVDSIIYHGSPLSFQRLANDGLQLLFPVILNRGQKDSVAIYYKGIPRNAAQFRPFNTSMHNGVPVLWTLSEPFGAKEWWPCKNGLSDKADSLDITLISPAAYRGTANGILMDETTENNNKIVHFRHRYPIVSYLVAIAVTNYATAADSVPIAGRNMPLLTNAYPEDAGQLAYAAYYAKQALPLYSALFGAYPFAKEQYAQTQVNIGGGMEHQTNSFIGSTWNQLVVHELGHHWFGDAVTCGSWQHIWLNEGFANYMQFIYVQHFDTSLIMPHLKYYQKLVVSQPGGSVFVPDTSNPQRIFDPRLTYAKGGYVVHMLRGILGDSVFFSALRQYLQKPALKNGFAVTADLQQVLEQASGKNLHAFFQKWIYGEGYPSYSCTWMQNSSHWAKVQINQTTSHPSVSFYEMPVQLQFRNSSRDTIITVDNRQNGEIFWVNVGFTADTMLVDPAYWILAKDRISIKMPSGNNTPDDISIYPNPAPAYLNILLRNPTVSQLHIQLYNSAGQLMYHLQKNIPGHDEWIILPTARFAPGAYILSLSAEGKLPYNRIIIR